MRRVLLVLLFAVILLPLASAETYRISGRATYADGSAVQLDYVSVQCEQSNFDCYQYRGTNVLTDAYGDFTVVIDADGEEDDSRAYVVMPNTQVFDRYAKRIEKEMKNRGLKEGIELDVGKMKDEIMGAVSEVTDAINKAEGFYDQYGELKSHADKLKSGHPNYAIDEQTGFHPQIG